MLRGLLVFYTALFSVAFLDRMLYRHHYTSLVFVLAGVTLAGLGPILLDSTEDDQGKDSHALYVFLIVVSQLFHGL